MTVGPGHPLYNMRRKPGTPPRWRATVWYQTEFGLIDVVHDIEELDMLQDLVERGPDFYTIDRIEIVINRK